MVTTLDTTHASAPINIGPNLGQLAVACNDGRVGLARALSCSHVGPLQTARLSAIPAPLAGHTTHAHALNRWCLQANIYATSCNGQHVVSCKTFHFCAVASA